MKHIVPFLFWVFAAGVAFGQRATISGYVKDSSNGEVLIMANVYDALTLKGTTTNNYGFFSLTLPSDTVHLVVSYVGYQSYASTFYLSTDTQIQIPLKPTTLLEEIEVKANRRERIEETTQMSTISLPVEDIKKLPAFMGEVDVLKVLQLLPGVQSGSEGSSGLYVRGGSPDQNLILLDGVPVYNVSHLFGFFSVFNADAINNVQLIKGGFPARYGGRLSSVLDIQMKEGNQKEFHGEGSLGVIASRLTLEGPIVKNKASFLISGRRTYIDLLAKPFINKQFEDGGTAGYYFYDLNGKVNWTLGKNDRLYLSAYLGDDKFHFKETIRSSNGIMTTEDSYGGRLTWGNLTSVLRWNHQYNAKLFSNLTLNYSKYEFDTGVEESSSTTENGQTTSEAFNLKYFSGITDWSLKIDYDLLPAPAHYIRFGASARLQQFKPGAIQFKVESNTDAIDTTLSNTFVDATELRGYFEDDIKLSDAFKVNLGVHGSAFHVRENWFGSVEPRVAARYLLSESLSLKVSGAMMKQYIHLLSNSGIGLPTDLWVPATGDVPPQSSWQVAAGIAKTIDRRFEVSLEGYYKDMQNIIEYKEGASYLENSNNWEDQVESGHGWSYGGELFIQKKQGKTTGWIGYTLSWTKRQFDNINFGKVFPFRYDRRHDISVAIVHRISKKVDLSGTWVYGTGNAVSLPLARYAGVNAGYDLLYPSSELYYYNERNGFRMAAYHRLDIGITLKKKTRWGQSNWNFSVYNAYNRKNPFFIYYGYDDVTGKREFKQVSLFPLLPSVSYQFKF